MVIERSLAELETRVRRDLALTAYPADPWMPERTGPDGARLLDVLIVGAGQGGLATAFLLKRGRVDNILAVDRAAAGGEGVWPTYARMTMLRGWKGVTGPDQGVPSLTFRAWYEAQHGAAAFAAMNKIPKEDWLAYLGWYRRVLELPVANGTEVTDLEPLADCVRATVRDAAGERSIHSRAVVLANGIDGHGRWWMPEHVAALPAERRAHTADPIDFAGLAGRRIAILGAAASAFDNAATALEAGAAEVRLFVRREVIQRVQPFKVISFLGFLKHLGDLGDAERWRMMRYLLDLREALPVETWERTTRHPNFELVMGAPWQAVAMLGDEIAITTPRGRFAADFVICGTGFDADLARRPELARIAPAIATWGDRYEPPAEEADPRLARYPYLGPGLEFLERRPGGLPGLARIRCYNFGATMSFGPSGASINAMKQIVPRLVGGITRALFAEDFAHHEARIRAYQEPEFPLAFARDERRAAE